MALMPKEFYPTPAHIALKMLDNIDFNYIKSVLEPSAGDGTLVKLTENKMRLGRQNGYGYNDTYKADIDCIEIDEGLRHILKGDGYKVVHDNFLTYRTHKQYDLIIMNPPFSNGDEHLLKALEMQKNGGIIVCLLNAETLKNTYSNKRKELLQKLEDLNANIEYIPDAFIGAERKTGVEIALIKVAIIEPKKESYIYEQLQKEETLYYDAEGENNSQQLAQNDFMKAMIDQYNLEVKAGINLIYEYRAMEPILLNSLDENDKYSKPILKLDFYDTPEHSERLNINEFVRRVRYKYWRALFDHPKFTGRLTENLRQDYYKRLEDLSEFDFSFYNIKTIQIEMNNNMIKGVEETILSLFDELSREYSYYDGGKNIHYYNGWKTNKAWKINKKVIIRLNGYGTYSGKIDYTYQVKHKLEDIEKVFNYLDCGRTEEVDIDKSLRFAQEYGETKKIPLKYFNVTFYMKGTCHIEFTNEELLHKFNLFGSQRKNWLPPSYGKARYTNMTAEEKTIIDEFEGEKSYNKTIADKEYYLVNSGNLLQLEAM